jgi:hypothetical protein
MKFEQLNIDELKSIDEVLKPYVKELFSHICKDKKYYKSDILDKIADDLYNGKFVISVPNDVSEDYTQKDGLSGINENKYIQEGIIEGLIIIFPAQLKKDRGEIIKTLSHEFEHYICQSNENIARNLDYLKSIDFNIDNIDDKCNINDLPEIGGFCGNIIQLKNRI